MPSLIDTLVAANYNKFTISQSGTGTEQIVAVTLDTATAITDAILLEVINQLTVAGGDGTGSDQDGPDAFTIGGLGTADGSAFESGVTETVYLRVQGSGTPDLSDVAGVSLATVCVFKPAK